VQKGQAASLDGNGALELSVGPILGINLKVFFVGNDFERKRATHIVGRPQDVPRRALQLARARIGR
jgi:hypothetical protein